MKPDKAVAAAMSSAAVHLEDAGGGASDITPLADTHTTTHADVSTHSFLVSCESG